MSTQPFVFREQFFLVRPLHRRAFDLPSLADLIEQAPDAAIFCHVHMAHLRPWFQRSGLLNNFASWVRTTLHEIRLSERLAVVDGATAPDLPGVRDALVEIVRRHMGSVQHGPACPRGREFHLCAAEGDAVATGRQARTVKELAAGLRECSDATIAHHLFAVPLRATDGVDDISRWLGMQDRGELAARVRAIPLWILSVAEVRAALCAALEGA